MAEIAVQCEECDATDRRIVFCSGCNFSQCEDCWERRLQHRKNLAGPGGIPHDKIDPQKVAELRACLAVPDTAEQQKEQHLQDEDTTWFGVARDQSDGQPVFQDHGRYKSIMAQTLPSPGQPRYPKIVSFVGETGAGKSTIIKLLIDLKRSSLAATFSTLSTPVVGKDSGDLATSADVHLYSDPETLSGDMPILYADCEGFNGGERSPVAASMVYQAQNETVAGVYSMAKNNFEGLSPLRKLANSSKRLLEWARREAPDSEKKSKRGYAVTELYPRILYAFSDVIVFVLRNARTLESVVEQLLQWAHASYERSVNQPSKPHAIIALNASELPDSSPEWVEALATASLLDSTSASIEKNATFKHYVGMWRKSGKDVWDMKGLLQCYYGTVHVVRLPTKSQLAKLDDQRHQLHDVITQGCRNSHQTRERSQMLPDADDLQNYLQLAFDHYSRSLDEPFDFIMASLKSNPIPLNFPNNVTRLACEVSDRQQPQLTTEVLFDKLTNIIASCIMLDAARNSLMGRPREWFERDIDESNISSNATKSYSYACSVSVANYAIDHAPCEGVTRSTLGKTIHCIKKQRVHGDMHRAAGVELLSGMNEWFGHYQSEFNIRAYPWHDQVLQALIRIESDFDSRSPSERRGEAVRKHLLVLRRFYLDVGSANRYHSNSICLCCLREPVQHSLPCGHMLCTPCATDFGYLEDEMLVVDTCPIHKDQNWRSPQTLMSLKPPFSGLRLLSLDGGGIRGIVELEILKAIETTLGKSFRISQFFDLIVGTSTGGIITLGLGTQSWSIDECIQQFLSLSRQAFILRSGQAIPGIKQMHLIVRHSRFKTAGIKGALQEAFGTKAQLFGDVNDHKTKYPKVAVTTTSATGDRAYILCNYNRREANQTLVTKDHEYTLHRPYKPAHEIFIWEAARMTSAAPGLFKPCAIVRNREILREYIDGGVLNNNPVHIAHREGKLLSAQYGCNEIPDIVLSVGTGRGGKEYEPSISSSQPEKRRAWLGTIFKLVKHQIEVNLDSERTWRRYAKQEASHASRIFRINPDLGYGPPELDDVAAMSKLQTTTKGLMVDNPTVREVACCLIASSFYFHKASSSWTEKGGVVFLSGELKCRFANDTDELKAVGLFIRTHTVVKPTFVVYGAARDFSSEPPVEYLISCEEMIQNGVFATQLQDVAIRGGNTEVSIELSLPGAVKDRQSFPISGFPRVLMQKDFKLK